MKRSFLSACLLSVAIAHAGPVTLETDQYVLNDVAESGLTSSKLFKGMRRNFDLMASSICANRAHVWAYDFKAQHNVDAAKIFLFFTKRSGNNIYLTWWYHVAPVINENGSLLVMDPSLRNRPEAPEKWLRHFTDTNRCYQIQDTDTDLLEHIYKQQTFPQVTSRGFYDCYYRLMPAGYWFPSHVSQRLLGHDEAGAPITVERRSVERSEAYSACIEAVSGPVESLFGGLARRKCRRFLPRRGEQ